MAKINSTRRIIQEDFDPENYDLIGRLGYVLNPLLEDLVTAFNKNLTIDENLNMEVKSIDVTVDQFNSPTIDLFYTSSLTSRVRGHIVLRTQNIQNNISNIIDKTITNISADTSSVITTDSDHNLDTGDLVTISGSDSTPSIDGSYKITALTPTTFQIPLTVSGAGNEGIASLSSGIIYPQNAPFLSFSQSNQKVKITNIAGIRPGIAYKLTVLSIG